MKKIGVVLGILITFLFVSAESSCEKSTMQAATESSCKSNEDCVLVKQDCCDCRRGGKQEALSKTKALEKIQNLSTKCDGVMCAQVMSNDPSCKQTAVCDKNQCVLQ